MTGDDLPGYPYIDLSKGTETMKIIKFLKEKQKNKTKMPIDEANKTRLKFKCRPTRGRFFSHCRTMQISGYQDQLAGFNP